MMSKINNNNTSDLDKIRAPRQTMPASAVKGKTEANDAKISLGEDKMRFSERAGEVDKLVDKLKDLPDTREAKINALREQIKAGEYDPSSEDIADAMLKEE